MSEGCEHGITMTCSARQRIAALEAELAECRAELDEANSFMALGDPTEEHKQNAALREMVGEMADEIESLRNFAPLSDDENQYYDDILARAKKEA